MGSEMCIRDSDAPSHNEAHPNARTNDAALERFEELRSGVGSHLSSSDMGALIIDGFCDGILLFNQSKQKGGKKISDKVTDATAFGILQAGRVRTSKTEYISCPGCGRTLYDLESTIARIKQATSHLKGLKIGIMGCIVNGPGEMADADYGYVGAGRGKISLYKKKECIEKNIPEEEAVEKLIELIKKNGDYTER